MNIRDYLSSEEIATFTRRSNVQASVMLLANWLSILGIFFIATRWTNPLTLVLASLLLGGRFLGLAVIMHECGHQTFFTGRAANRFCGQWLCALPILSDLHLFAANHLKHHRGAGTADDPDLENYRNYPVSLASLKRKVTRDLTGQTGMRLLGFVLGEASGIFSKQRRTGAIPYVKAVLTQLAVALLLGVLFAPWAYLLWLGTIAGPYMLIVRLRQVAEHAGVPNLFDKDPRNNARTTLPRWWERIVLAPNRVSYHLEHHLMASVPCYRLPELHRLLRQRGAYDNTKIYRGYGEVLAAVVTD